MFIDITSFHDLALSWVFSLQLDLFSQCYGCFMKIFNKILNLTKTPPPSIARFI